jgi:hypothetical protein
LARQAKNAVERRAHSRAFLKKIGGRSGRDRRKMPRTRKTTADETTFRTVDKKTTIRLRIVALV